MPFYQTFNRSFKREKELPDFYQEYCNIKDKLGCLGITINRKDSHGRKILEEKDESYSILLPTTPIAEAYICSEKQFSGNGRLLLGVRHFKKEQKFPDIETIAREHELTPDKPFESHT